MWHRKNINAAKEKHYCGKGKHYCGRGAAKKPKKSENASNCGLGKGRFLHQVKKKTPVNLMRWWLVSKHLGESLDPLLLVLLLPEWEEGAAPLLLISPSFPLFILRQRRAEINRGPNYYFIEQFWILFVNTVIVFYQVLFNLLSMARVVTEKNPVMITLNRCPWPYFWTHIAMGGMTPQTGV